MFFKRYGETAVLYRGFETVKSPAFFLFLFRLHELGPPVGTLTAFVVQRDLYTLDGFHPLVDGQKACGVAKCW